MAEVVTDHMDDNIAALMAMLDWNNPQEEQEEGIALARKVEDPTVFLQPLSPAFNKNVWDNCARILYERTDDALKPHLVPLLEWLQDLNWPGALTIAKRLSFYKDRSSLALATKLCMARAKEENDGVWPDNLMQMLP